MKVVINVCFGGFSLSRAAVARMAELQGRPCYFFTHAYENGRYDLHRWVPAPERDGGRDMFWTALDIPNPNEVLLSDDSWQTRTQEERQAANALYYLHTVPNGRGLDRDDPLLIRVVEELGEAANGACAELKIVEIPDGVPWEISEYDGNEHIAETHRTWS